MNSLNILHSSKLKKTTRFPVQTFIPYFTASEIEFRKTLIPCLYNTWNFRAVVVESQSVYGSGDLFYNYRQQTNRTLYRIININKAGAKRTQVCKSRNLRSTEIHNSFYVVWHK